jgi:hypothetical protein
MNIFIKKIGHKIGIQFFYVNFKNETIGHKIGIQFFYVNLKNETIPFLFFNKTKAFHMINKPTNPPHVSFMYFCFQI